MTSPDSVRLLHISDVHFGPPAVLAQVDAVAATIARERFDLVAFSGDASQRSLSGEFQAAARFLSDARQYSPTLCIPGNHDVAWWYAPLGLGKPERMLERYRRYLGDELEPMVELHARTAGAMVVGLNTSHGITWRTLTRRPRDLSIIGDVTPAQLDRLRARLATAAPGVAKVVVMHHNPVRGELSQRFGIRHPQDVLDAFAEMGVDLVLCGHDHQEAVTRVERPSKTMIVSTAGTLSDRSRAARPSSYHVITITPDAIALTARIWSDAAGDFVPGSSWTFNR